MGDVMRLPYINTQRGRDGRVRHWYFRRNGRRWILPEPGDPPSQEFLAEYQRLLDLTAAPEGVPPAPSKPDYPPRSLGALIGTYLASAAFKQNKLSTQAEYRRALERLQRDDGQKSVAGLKRRHIRQFRDDLADTPGAANTRLRALKLLLNFAVEEEWIEHSPGARVPELKGGEYRAWSDDECATFEQHWPAGTMQRRAYALALYTGQRRSDLVAMTRAHRKDGLLHVMAQEKTGEEVWIPEHWELAAELDAGDQSHMSLLTTTRGKAFDPVYFGAWFAKAIDAAKLPSGCVLHGLRKTAATRLADAGCTEGEIMAITGHRTSRMVAKYTKAASKRKAAGAAILKLENARGRSSGKQSGG